MESFASIKNDVCLFSKPVPMKKTVHPVAHAWTLATDVMSASLNVTHPKSVEIKEKEDPNAGQALVVASKARFT